MKTITYICLVITLILGINLFYYIVKPEPEVKRMLEVSKLKPNEPVIQMDTKPENYDCYDLTDIQKNKLVICNRKIAINREIGKAYVRGIFDRQTNIIYLDKNMSNDMIAHELFHYADIRYRGKDEETRAYLFQDLYNKTII